MVFMAKVISAGDILPDRNLLTDFAIFFFFSGAFLSA